MAAEATATTVVRCPGCGRGNRLRGGVAGVPHCGSCGRPLPWLVEASEADFSEIVERSPLPALIDFWAPWCGPCRMVAPAVEQISRDLAGRLKVVKVNTDREPSLAQRFGVRGIPTLVLIRGGAEQDRVTGAMSAAALRSWVERQLA
ncbi:MAG TPA: thioredoxin [Candidatus Dormibacteraeota bacterium]|jgi:thioredoxin 2|nr:thioredoxin [Candidatus Dormibacteraeota bacterium]